MNERLEVETRKLTDSWMRHEADWLRDYLVGSVEDPRLNVQSILTRHFLIDALTPENHAPLMEAELRFAICLTWLLKQIELGAGPEDFSAIHHGLRVGSDNAEGLHLPEYLGETFAQQPAADAPPAGSTYLNSVLVRLAQSPEPTLRGAPELDGFMEAWRTILAPLEPTGVAVLEPACGSANDYRAIAACGLGELIHYHGFDLCIKNVANARTMHPDTRFDVGNVFAIPANACAYDLLIAHDLFEHLSPEGLEQAIREVCRVTRNELCVGFFNMHEEGWTVVREVEDYHWNTLDAGNTRALFEAAGFDVQIVSIDAFLRQAFRCKDQHNPRAYTFRCRRPE
ncbi:MAG: class I SAM-dependent methyltransferase [Verrucomicrobiales bacterium]|nr:class I SAM-dependent methyltransferase [Verrucomicrobiales bacterium]